MKAKFMVTIVHDEGSKVFFNMPLKDQQEVRGQANTVSLIYCQEYFFSPEFLPNFIDKRFWWEKAKSFREILDIKLFG